MKITKKQLKALIREQVKAVIEAHDDYHDDDWFDILSKKDRPPLPWGSDEEEGPEVDDVEWMEDRFHDDQEDWSDEEELPGPGDRPAWEDDASHPDSPDYEEEEGVVDLRGIHSTMMDPMQYHSPEARRRRFEKRQGRIKESELKDMIRATLEEVLPLGTSHADAVSRSHGASGRQGAADFTYNKEGMGWKTLDQMDSTDLKRAANDLYNLIYGHLEIEAVDTYDPTEPLMMLLHALLPGKE